MIREGSLVLSTAIKSQINSSSIFYSPHQIINRSISCACLNTLVSSINKDKNGKTAPSSESVISLITVPKEANDSSDLSHSRNAISTQTPILILDLYCGIGSRGLRYASELGFTVGANVSVVGVDQNESSIACAISNAGANNLTSTCNFICQSVESFMNETAERVSNKNFEGFDIIEIDPFGSPFKVTDFAISNRIVKHGGLLCLTCTDTDNIDNYSKRLFPHDAWISKDVLLRLLLSNLSRSHASVCSIESIASWSFSHGFRYVIQILYHTPIARSPFAHFKPSNGTTRNQEKAIVYSRTSSSYIFEAILGESPVEDRRVSEYQQNFEKRRNQTSYSSMFDLPILNQCIEQFNSSGLELISSQSPSDSESYNYKLSLHDLFFQLNDPTFVYNSKELDPIISQFLKQILNESSFVQVNFEKDLRLSNINTTYSRMSQSLEDGKIEYANSVYDKRVIFHIGPLHDKASDSSERATKRPKLQVNIPDAPLTQPSVLHIPELIEPKADLYNGTISSTNSTSLDCLKTFLEEDQRRMQDCGLSIDEEPSDSAVPDYSQTSISSSPNSCYLSLAVNFTSKVLNQGSTSSASSECNQANKTFIYIINRNCKGCNGCCKDSCEGLAGFTSIKSFIKENALNNSDDNLHLLQLDNKNIIGFDYMEFLQSSASSRDYLATNESLFLILGCNFDIMNNDESIRPKFLFQVENFPLVSILSYQPSNEVLIRERNKQIIIRQSFKESSMGARHQDTCLLGFSDICCLNNKNKKYAINSKFLSGKQYSDDSLRVLGVFGVDITFDHVNYDSVQFKTREKNSLIQASGLNKHIHMENCIIAYKLTLGLGLNQDRRFDSRNGFSKTFLNVIDIDQDAKYSSISSIITCTISLSKKPSYGKHEAQIGASELTFDSESLRRENELFLYSNKIKNVSQRFRSTAAHDSSFRVIGLFLGSRTRAVLDRTKVFGDFHVGISTRNGSRLLGCLSFFSCSHGSSIVSRDNCFVRLKRCYLEGNGSNGIEFYGKFGQLNLSSCSINYNFGGGVLIVGGLCLISDSFCRGNRLSHIYCQDGAAVVCARVGLCEGGKSGIFVKGHDTQMSHKLCYFSANRILDIEFGA